MKKSLIAVAVAGAVGAPMSAAQAEVYGFVNVGIDAVSKDGTVAAGGFQSGPSGDEGANTVGLPGSIFGGFNPDVIFAAGNDGSLHMSDTAETRFGFKGSEDLGNGLTAGYRFEFGLGTEAFGGGSVIEDTSPTTRLANVSLSGDFGMVKVGTQWGTVYEYLGWNVFRSSGHGGAGWYYATRAFETSPAGEGSGLRVGNAITYTYGAGGYGSDPFTFTVQAGLAPDTGTGAAENDATFDFTTVGAQGTFGDFQVNGVAHQQNEEATGASEPSLTGIGVRWNSGDLYIGGNFTVTDLDLSGVDDLEVLQVLATYDFGGGNSGMAGFSSGDSGDINADLSGIFLQFAHQLSSRTQAYVEIEQAEIENIGAGGDDVETSVVSLNLMHSF